jgi:LCP family protein required for cell wall assembly
MNDWRDGWSDANQHGGGEEAPHVLTGKVWPSETHQGYPHQGYPDQEYPQAGYPHQEYPHSGYPHPGYPHQEYPAVAPQDLPPSGSAPHPVAIPPQRDRRADVAGGDHRPGQEDGPTPGPSPSPTPSPRARRPKPPAGRGRKIARTVVVLIAMLLATSLGTYIWADSKLHRDIDLSKAADRPPPGKGTNYLIVGSDSRQGLSEEAKKNLHTGSAEGGRTDSMMVLHTGAHGATMMSLPRDSWVTIPSYVDPGTGKHYRAAKNKLNAAYSLGGPDLLVRTIEHNTGLRIDHYAEIGFSGFVGVVDAVGGVKMCVDRHIKDEKSGLDLTKGCHTLDGAKALAFVRQRHQEAQGDLGRTKNQQKFLAALADKAATPGIMANPFKIYPTASAALDTLVVDKDMGLSNLYSLFEAMRSVTAGDGERINVPVSSLGFKTSKGSAVAWNVAQAKKLFAELRKDQRVTITEKN